MGHQAGREFFDTKRPWSKRKDRILDYYLTPYLWKIASIKKPIVVVDAFAGPGKFGTGEDGSPLIIANAITSLVAKRPDARCTEICIESDPELHVELAKNLRSFPFCSPKLSTFLDSLPRIEKLATFSSVFIYADPYAVDGLEWEAMDRVFQCIATEGSSVELLLNFNARAFVRRARAALHLSTARGDPGDDEGPSSNVAVTTLSRIVGGDWWRQMVTPDGWFSGEVEAIAKRLKEQLGSRFGEAGMYDIRAHLTDTVPKYYLIFASRHPDGLCLINDAVCKDREGEIGKASSAQGLLFEQSPQLLPSAHEVLRPAVLRHLRDGMTRLDLQMVVTRELFGKFGSTAIRNEIGKLRVEGQIRTHPNTTSWNNDSQLFHA